MKPKKLIWLAALIVMCFTLGGCQTTSRYLFPSHNEISHLDPIKIFGTDYDPVSDRVRVGVLLSSEDPTSKSGGGSTESGSEQETRERKVVSIDGRSVNETTAKIDLGIDRILERGHVDYLLFGEAAAQKDIASMMDTYARDNKMRGTVKVYITKDCDAIEMINRSLQSSFFLNNKLNAFSIGYKTSAVACEVSMLDLMKWCTSRQNAFLVPALELTPEAEPTTIDVAGYAIFRDSKLIGYIDRTYSKYATILLNKEKTLTIAADDNFGNPFTIDVTYANREIEIDFDKEANELRGITISVHFRSDISEIRSTDVFSTFLDTGQLEEIQNEKMRSYMSVVIAQSQELGADFIGISRYIKVRYPDYWDENEQRWAEIYQGIPIHLDVRSMPERSYELSNPVGSDENDLTNAAERESS